MRYGVLLVLGCLLLSGCGAQETMETVADVWAEPVMVTQRNLRLELPEGAASPVSDSGGGQWYDCDGFEVGVQTLSAGDLDATLRNLTGFGRDALYGQTVLLCLKTGAVQVVFTGK